MNRLQLIAKYSYKYKKLRAINKTFRYSCFYCGSIANEEDHYPPIKRIEEETYSSYILIPSCGECNRLLHDSMQETLEDRRVFVQTKLTAKYQKYLNVEWSNEELIAFYKDSGDNSLYRSIAAHRQLQKEILCRLTFTGYLFSIGDENKLQAEFKPCFTMIKFEGREFLSHNQLKSYLEKVYGISSTAFNKEFNLCKNITEAVHNIQRNRTKQYLIQELRDTTSLSKRALEILFEKLILRNTEEELDNIASSIKKKYKTKQ